MNRDVDISVSPSAHALRRALRQVHHSLEARVRSLLADAAYVDGLRALYPDLPVFANLRAGAWHVDPTVIAGVAYFKSTDGHHGVWAVPASRLNLAFAAAAARAGGALLVDATRRGKRFPDALSRTVPLWAAVVNAVVLDCPVDDGLALPPWVPPSERSQIRAAAAAAVAGLPPAIAALLRTSLQGQLRAPLRCHWVCAPGDADDGGLADGSNGDSGGGAWEAETPPLLLPRAPRNGAAGVGAACADDDDDDDDEAAAAYTPIVCVSASRRVAHAGDATSARAGWCYVQGAGDDSENWAPSGLTPATLYARRHALEACADDGGLRDVLDVIARDACAGSGGRGGSGSDNDAGCVCTAIAGERARVVWLPPNVAGHLPLTVAVGVVAVPRGGAALRDVGCAASAVRGPASASPACAADMQGVRWPTSRTLYIRVLPLGDRDSAHSSPSPADLPLDGLRREGAGGSAADTGAGGDVAQPRCPGCVTLRVPSDKRAHRRAAAGTAWQLAVFAPLAARVQDATRAALVGASVNGTAAAVTPAPAPDAVAVVAPPAPDPPRVSVVVACDAGDGLEAHAAVLAAFVALLPPPGAAAAATPHDKAHIRGVLAGALAAAGAPSVPRELQQQLHVWCFGRARVEHE